MPHPVDAATVLLYAFLVGAVVALNVTGALPDKGALVALGAGLPGVILAGSRLRGRVNGTLT